MAFCRRATAYEIGRPATQRCRARRAAWQLVTVVSVPWFASEALELTYKISTGKVANEFLYRDNEHRLENADGICGNCSRVGRCLKTT